MDQIDNHPIMIMEEVKSYGEWIELGKQNLESDQNFAHQCYEKALGLTDDKYEPYFLIAQAHRMLAQHEFFFETLRLALDFANDKVDRLIVLANEYKLNNLQWFAMEINGWAKELDPTFDGEVPKTYQDYKEIFYEYFKDSKRIRCATRSIEKIIELSQNKVDELIEIGGQILLTENIEMAQKYFARALEIKEDKYEVLIKIGDAYMNYKLYDSSLQNYTDANQLSPHIITAKLKIAYIKLELNQFQEALDYINNLEIPLGSQIYFDIGILLSKYESTLNEGKVFIQQGLDLTDNKFEILKDMIKKFWGKQINKFLLEKALEINGEDVSLIQIYADHICNHANERSEDTINAIKKVLNLDPNAYQNTYYANYLETTYVELKQFNEAIEYFKQYALTLQAQDQTEQIIKDQLENLLRLGQMLTYNKQFDEAFKYYQSAMELDNSPTKDVAFNFRGYIIIRAIILYGDNSYENCIKLCEQYEKCQPYISYFYKAQNLVRLNRIQEAIDLLELLQQINYDYGTQDQLAELKTKLQQQLEEKQQNEKTE